MATLAAPRLPAREPDRALHLRPPASATPRPLRRGALISAILSLFALAVHGYHPYAEDGGLYLAGVKRLLDPALYPYSAAFVLEPTRYSGFANLVAGIAGMCGPHAMEALPWILLLLHLGTTWATLFSAWMLTGRLFPACPRAQSGAVLLLACWLSLPVAGTALLLMDPYLTARSISTPCMILAILGVWDWTAPEAAATPGAARWRSPTLTIASLVLAATMHPLMAAYNLCACLALLILRVRSPRRRLAGSAAFCAAALTLAAALQATATPESADYVAIALTRSYWFLAHWRWFEWVGMVAPLAILGAFSGTERRADRQASPIAALAQAALLLGFAASATALLFARPESATHLVGRLQPMRALQFPYLVMILLLGGRLGERLLTRSSWRLAVAAVALSAPLYGASRSAYPNSPHLELPGSATRNAWVEAFLWIRNHTPTDALFALDPDYIQIAGEDAQCFRAIAERSALPDRSKDGGEAAIAPELTPAWIAGQAAQRTLHTGDDATRQAALRPLAVNWVVLTAASSTGFECLYTNSAVKVCRLP